MIRKVHFPIKLKIVAMVSVILISAMSYYVYLAVDLFRQDKRAAVYSEVLSRTTLLGQSLNIYFNQKKDVFDAFLQIYLGKGQIAPSEILPAFSNIKELVLFKIDNGVPKIIFNHENQNQSTLVDGDNNLTVEASYLVKKALNKENSILMAEDLVMAFPLFIENYYAMAKTSMEDILSILQKNAEEKILIVDKNGLVISGEKDQQNVILSDYAIKMDKLVDGIGQVHKTNDKFGKSLIVSSSPVGNFGLFVIKEISEDKVFEASKLLINKSIYYGLFILSLAFIFIILFSRRLTKHLQTLFQGTVFISSGDFGQKVEIPSNDEVGALGDSFNLMGQKIIELLEDVKEKARLENEVAVAKLVQSYFFPQEELIHGKFNLSGHFIPASECGGDWWGALPLKDGVLFVVADATGHGIPAALLTSSAYACMSFIKKSVEQGEFEPSPAKVLEALNHVIKAVGANIQMTAFVALFKEDENRLYYSNASHNPPLVFIDDQMHILQDVNGARLGEKEFQKYEEASCDFPEGAKIVAFSDGLVDLQNEKGRKWGQKSLVKSVIDDSQKDLTGLKLKLISQGLKHAQGKMDDDITLLIARNGPLKSKQKMKVFADDDLLKKEVGEIKLFDWVSGRDDADIYLTDCKDIMNLEKIEEKKGQTVICLSDAETDKNVLEALGSFKVQHIISKHGPNYLQELEDTIEKLNTNNIWGIERHLQNVEILRSVKVYSTKDISKALNEIFYEFPVDDYFESPVQYLKQSAEELLSNALLHTKMTVVELTLAMGENGLGIAIRDDQGGLNPEQLIIKLKRAFHEKTASQETTGAGLGLYMALMNSNRFIINLVPGVRTETICIIEKNKRYKEFKKRVPSIHLFTETL